MTGGDGLPDVWRLQYFGHTDARASDQSEAQDDPDGDTMTNFEEFLAGTNPTNALSRLAFVVPTTASRLGNGWLLSWESVSNRLYSLDCTTNPSAAPWLNLATNLPGTGQRMNYTNTTAQPAFFRLGVR